MYDALFTCGTICVAEADDFEECCQCEDGLRMMLWKVGVDVRTAACSICMPDLIADVLQRRWRYSYISRLAHHPECGSSF